MERAVSDVDEGFATSYDARRRHREVSDNKSMVFALFKFPNSCVMDKPSGIHPHLSLTSPSGFPTLCRLKLMVCNRIRLVYMRTSVSVMLHVMSHPSHSILGMDSRRRIRSRPSSTLSYNRTDMVTPGIYAPSPAPDPAANQTAFNHQDAMDSFTVRESLVIKTFA